MSVIDMPPTEDRSWWRGKRGFQVTLAGAGWEDRGPQASSHGQSLTLQTPQVGFFPSECVELFTERPSPGLKGGKSSGHGGDAHLPCLLSTEPLPHSPPQMLTVP